MKTSSELKHLTENVVTKRITQTLKICEKRRMLTLIFGETGRGKTLTAQHWAAEHPNARHIMLDSTTTLAKLVRRIARELFGESRGSTEENKAAIERYLLDNDTMLIIDEANQMLDHPSLFTKKKCLEYIRLDIFERTNTPVALIFTTYTLAEFEHGRLSAFLEQFLGRAMNRCSIPPGVFVSEVTPIVLDYFPKADPELIKAAVEIAGSNGKIRSLDAYLSIMQGVAAEKNLQPNADLLRAICANYQVGDDWPEE